MEPAHRLASTCEVLTVATFAKIPPTLCLLEAAAGVTKCDQNLQRWVKLLHVELLPKQMNKKWICVAAIWLYHNVQNEVAMICCSGYRKSLVLFCRGVVSIVPGGPWPKHGHNRI
jgi:hypothetical protein